MFCFHSFQSRLIAPGHKNVPLPVYHLVSKTAITTKFIAISKCVLFFHKPQNNIHKARNC